MSVVKRKPSARVMAPRGTPRGRLGGAGRRWESPGLEGKEPDEGSRLMEGKEQDEGRGCGYWDNGSLLGEDLVRPAVEVCRGWREGDAGERRREWCGWWGGGEARRMEGACSTDVMCAADAHASMGAQWRNIALVAQA